jgi:DNA-binding beta-propeller fold protein YncE
VATLEQPAAFLGAAFSRDGKELYVSGGNDDSIFCYSWENGGARLLRKIVLGHQKTDKTGSRYPAGLAVSMRENYLYVAENVGDDIAVVDLSTKQVVQRLATDHYPYAVEVASDGKV